MKCRICKNSNDNKNYRVKEMMFGTREEFDYFECSNCYCLQIAKIPEDFSKIYPNNYYAYTNFSPSRGLLDTFKQTLRRKRNFADLTGMGILGNILNKFYPSSMFQILRKIGIGTNSKILDVGCGRGLLLNDLREMGYAQVLGVDPYIEKDIQNSNGVRILRKFLKEIRGHFDLVMFHHSFEHLPNPLETLQSLLKILAKDGKCIIRMPTVSSYAWEYYGVNWVAIDPPRHIFVHSLDSISLLCAKAGFKLNEVIYDSTFYQFWASEQIKKDIPLNSDISYNLNPKKSIFSKQYIKKFKQKAVQLNRENRGDWFALIISPA